ncbi:Myotubularin-related protein 10-A [Geodia barretti]|nr:Myotubularin-related protein 10-A [Geodia barretti]
MYAVSMARNIGHQIENKGTATLDITRTCGTVWDLRSAFSNMRDLSMPGSPQELAGLDRKWLTGMESAGWLPMVRNCLRLAKTVSQNLCIDHRPVFLQEEGGRDLSCVVSSLAQLMMDPHYRSISGFQALVQKDWVAMGHPFSTRHHLITKPPSLSPDSVTDEPSVEAPTFLLFLDCVWQLSLQFPSAFEFSEFYLLQLHSLTYASLYGTFVFNSPKICLQVAMLSRHSQFFGSDEGVPDSNETCYEGLLRPAWGHWRDNLTREDREYCHNPLYYIFGNSEARYDFNTSDPLPMYDQFSSIFDDTAPNLVVGGSYGLYNRDSPMKDLHVAGRGKTSHHYQQGLLLPETSGCSVKPWLGFFARHIPDFQEHFAEQRRVREREVRLVKDVRRLKDTLNELELSVGAITSDLTSFVGAILAARERERRNRMSSLSPDHAHRPRLSAMLVPSDDVEVRGSEVNSSSKTLPTKVQSLAEFTETLYMFSDDRGTPSGLRKSADGAVGGASPGPGNALSPGSGRSPITKTRLRVTRTESIESSSLHSRTPGPASGHIPLLANKILIREQNVGPEEEERGGETAGKRI